MTSADWPIVPFHLLPPWCSLPPSDTDACSLLQKPPQGVCKVLKGNAVFIPNLPEGVCHGLQRASLNYKARLGNSTPVYKLAASDTV